MNSPQVDEATELAAAKDASGWNDLKAWEHELLGLGSFADYLTHLRLLGNHITTVRAELDQLRDGVERIITERGGGDFAPLLPKLRALVSDSQSDAV